MQALSRAKHVSPAALCGVVQAAVSKSVRGCVGSHPPSDSSSPRTTDTSFQLTHASSHCLPRSGRYEFHSSTLKPPASLPARSFGTSQSKLSTRSNSGSLAGFSLLGVSHSLPLRSSLSRQVTLGLRAFHATNVAQAKRDPYEVLEVPRSATQAEVKKAYFAKAKKFHPDVNTEDPKAKDKFAEINAAYEILGNAEKRKLFDQGMMDTDGNNAGFGGGGFGGFSGFQGAPDDIFEELANMFGGRQGSSRRGEGKDINIAVTISFMEAAKGTTKSVSYEVKDSCVTCDGSGAQPGSKPRTCGTCRGTGETVNRTMGVFQMHSTCRVCRGQGSVIDRPCTTCKGEGRVGSRKTTEVQIPAGMSEEVRLRIANQGEPGVKGAAPGNLYVQVQIQPHPQFQRNGYDVHITLPISISQAMMGARISVPGIDGDQMVAISPGTQPGSTKVLRNHGIRHLNNPQQYGDLIIHFKVEIPRKLTDKQRELMQEFAKTETAQQN